MRDFNAIVAETSSIVGDVAQNKSHRRRIALQFVGNSSKRFFPLTAQQSSKESFRGTLIATRLNQNIDHIAILIDSTP